MNLAARFHAAGYAVSSLGLAALAVSAMPAAVEAPAPVVHDAPAYRAWIAELTVIGSAEHAVTTWEIKLATDAFSDCASSTARVTLFAHFSGGILTELSANGDDPSANACAMQRFDRFTVSVLDEMDVMIPIDFAPRS